MADAVPFLGLLLRCLSRLVAGALLMALALSAAADTVTLTDGRVLEADAIREDGESLLLTHRGTLVRVPRARVKALQRASTDTSSTVFPPADLSTPADSAQQGRMHRLVGPRGELIDKALPGAGQITLQHTPAGDFYRYIPRMLRQPIRVAWLFHGTPRADETALDVARQLIESSPWVPFAENEGVIVCSVALDDARYFGSRYLYGRLMPADRFLIYLHERLGEELGPLDPRMILYGHSAGAQFVTRFALVHPQRVATAVASAPGSYAYPDPKLAWPFGLHGAPNPGGFIEASALPITILVGRQDLEPLPSEELQHGTNRVLRAENWVREMRELAEQNGRTPGIQLVLVQGLSHTSYELTPEAMQYFRR